MRWQTFTITGGIVQRNDSGQYEGLLELSGGLKLSFVFDKEGANWGWEPVEPAFIADWEEDDD